MPASFKLRPPSADLIPPTPTERMESTLQTARIGMEHTRAALIRDMRQVRLDLEHAILRLERGIAPNGLGVLQASATMIDAKCGNLAAQQEAYERLAVLASRLGLLPPVEEG